MLQTAGLVGLVNLTMGIFNKMFAGLAWYPRVQPILPVAIGVAAAFAGLPETVHMSIMERILYGYLVGGGAMVNNKIAKQTVLGKDERLKKGLK